MRFILAVLFLINFFLMFTLYDALSDIPVNLLISHKSFPLRKPVIVRVGMDIYQTRMNFDTGTLLVYGAAVLGWTDSRKTWSASTFNGSPPNFDAGLNPNEYQKVESNLWIPTIKNRFQMLTFSIICLNSGVLNLSRNGTNLYSDRLYISETGNIVHEFRFILSLSCNQESFNYPYDTYSCWENLGDYDRNETVKYATPLIRSDYMVLMPNFRHSGHSIINYTSYKYTKDMVDIDRRLFNFYPELIDIGFTIQRAAPKLLATVVIPIYAITFIDAVFFIFGPNSILRISMIPAYLIHFSDMSFTNTVHTRPIISRWFFARLVSSIFCNLWFVFATTTSRNSEILLKNATSIYRRALSSWPRRMLIITFTTIIFYSVMSLPMDLKLIS